MTRALTAIDRWLGSLRGAVVIVTLVAGGIMLATTPIDSAGRALGWGLQRLGAKIVELVDHWAPPPAIGETRAAGKLSVSGPIAGSRDPRSPDRIRTSLAPEPPPSPPPPVMP